MRAGNPWKAKRPRASLQPARENLVLREELQRQFVGAVDVLRVARERHPAERPLARAEERTNVLGHKAGNQERVRAAGVEGEAANVVAVVEGHRAGALQGEHRIHVNHHRRRRAAHVLRRIAAPQLRGLAPT